MVTLRCKLAELVYMTALEGSSSVFGLDDPFRGWFAEDVVSSLAEARKDLISRGWLEKGTANTTHLIGEYKELVRAISFPTCVFTLGGNASGEALPYATIYWSSTYGVRLDHADSHCYLTRIQDFGEIHHICEAIWPTNELRVPDGQTQNLELDTIEKASRALQQMGGTSVALQILLDRGLSSKTARSFVWAIARPGQSGFLIGWSNHKTGWTSNGLAFLESATGLWILRPYKRLGASDGLEIRPVSSQQFRIELERLINRCHPASN